MHHNLVSNCMKKPFWSYLFNYIVQWVYKIVYIQIILCSIFALEFKNKCHLTSSRPTIPQKVLEIFKELTARTEHHIRLKLVCILATANTVFRRTGPFNPRLRMRRINTLVTRWTNAFWLPLYTGHRRPQLPDFTKKDQVSWMCFIISSDLYTAHHNSLGIMSSAQNPSFVWNLKFLDPEYLYGDRKLVCLWFSSFSWKDAPVFAVASIFVDKPKELDTVPIAVTIIKAFKSTVIRTKGDLDKYT